jgi:hypothetical protein
MEELTQQEQREEELNKIINNMEKVENVYLSDIQGMRGTFGKYEIEERSVLVNRELWKELINYDESLKTRFNVIGGYD